MYQICIGGLERGYVCDIRRIVIYNDTIGKKRPKSEGIFSLFDKIANKVRYRYPHR